jgi:negative regulator of flagellin synthesis FlgM
LAWQILHGTREGAFSVTTIHRGQDVTGLAGLGSGSTDRTQAAQGQSAQAQNAVQPATTGPRDDVEITPTAQLLATLEQRISSTPDINQGRVDAIRAALDNGSYQVDSARVADGLLAAQKFDAQAATAADVSPQSNPAKAFADTAKG